jgi:hypothetical protein
MRSLYTKFLTLIFVFLTTYIHSQITITVTGNTNTTPNLLATYPSLSAALTDLNLVTAMTGPVILTCDAGTSETAPPTGFTLGSASLNLVLNSTNTITINKTGGVVTINAGVGTSTPGSAAPDGILKLLGADYVEINGLTFTDGNAANPATMEYGLGLFKRVAGDGCNNNLIRNCIFNMQRINNAGGTAPMFDGSVGILVINSTPVAATTPLTPTNGGTLATNGTNSGNIFQLNTINGGNIGIGLSGFLATAGVGPTPNAATFLGDLNNQVGTSGRGNTILNFGGGAATSPAAGIRANHQWSISILDNTIDNNDGGGVNHTTTLRGIFAQAGTSANATIVNNTVTVRSGATTSGLVAIENGIGSTAASNTININNNTIRLSYTTATSGVMTAITNSSTAAAVNINFNNIQGVPAANYPSTGTIPMIVGGSPGGTMSVSNNTISNFTLTGASGTFRAITASTPAGLYTVENNTIENISYTTVGSTGNITGIYNLASATLQNVNNNIIRNFSTPTAGTLNGIQNNTVTGTFQCQNNQIYNFTTSAGGAGGFSANGITWTNANVTISGNLIYSINSTGTTGGTGGTINGITFSGAATVTRNAIYDLSSNSTNAVINGIVVSASGTNNVNNNLVGDLRAPNSTGNVAISGILVSSGTTNNIFHNTVNIASTTTSATSFGTSAIYFSSASPVNNLRNNIFVNTSDPGPTGGFATAIRYTTAPTTTNFPVANNNNFYYAGTAAANRVIYCEGSTATPSNGQQTIALYKTYISVTLPAVGRESASVSEVPNWASTTGSNPITNFLQYNTAISTQIEQGGLLGTGISTDFAGTTRCPGGSCPGAAATPDRGAWELNGTPLDLTGPAITYTTIGNTSCLTDRNLSAGITDPSMVNVTAGTKPRIYFKKSTDANTYAGNTNADNGWKYVEASNAATPFALATDYTLLQSAIAIGDIIQYFVVAQDLAITPNVGINSGTFAATPASVALTSAAFPLTGVINEYTIVSAGLTGTVNVGTSETYSTLTGAGGLFSAINTSGLSGNLTVNLMDASISESGANALNAINYNGCAAGPYNVTIKPNTTSILTGTVGTGAIIKLNGADNVTIDGSNSGGSDRSLTIQNLTTTTSGNAVIWLASPASGNGSNNNTIKNCIIEGNSSTTTFTGVHLGGNTTIGIATAGSDRNDNNVINNNLLRKSIYGVTMFGYLAGTPDLNNVISNNNFGTSTVGEGFSLLAINADRQQNLVVSGNEVQNVVNATNTSSTPFGGIRLLDFKNGLCFNNNIHDLAYTGTSTPKIYGIAVTSSSYTTALNPSNAQIYNNMVSRITTTGTSGVWNLTGMLASAGYGDKFYYNTVHLTGQLANNSSGLAAAFANGDGNVTTVCTNIDVRNNLFSIAGTNGAVGGNFWAYTTQATSLAGSTINHNAYNSNSTNVTNNIGRFNGISHTTLLAWQAATSQDANSFVEAPIFVSNSDAHLNMGLTGTRLEEGGTVISGITTDIDGQTRPGPSGSLNGGGTIPDVGADEFDGVPAAPMTYSSSTVTQVTGGSATPSTDQQVIRIEVVTSGTLSPLAATSFTVNANGTTNIADINTATAKIYYTGATPTFSPVGLFGSATPTIANFNIVGSQTLLTGNNYFWLAYDVASGATNGNLLDGECTSVTVGSAQTPTVTAPSGSRTIVGPMSGNYNVGSSETFPNFTTITEAASNLNSRGVSGAVTLTLLDANYAASETFPIVFNAIVGASATNTITMKPGTSVTSTITGAANSAALIRLNGTDFFTIDGSNNGSTSQNLTIMNSGTTSPSAIWLSAIGGVDAGAQNNTIKNCILSTTTTTSTTSFGVVIGSSTIGSSGDDNDNNTVQNNTISGPNTGIYAIGNAAVSALGMDNVVIEDNTITITNTISTAYGMRVGNSIGGAVTNNTVSVTTTASTAPVGISLETGFLSGSCNDNKIGPVTTSATGGYGGRGITVGTGSASSSVTIANNEIFGVNGSNWSGFTNSSAMGICIGVTPGNSTTLSNTTGGLQIYFNSINLYGNHSFTTATNTAGIYVGSAASALDIRNNVFVNSLNNITTAGSKNYGIYSAVANTAFTNINNNNYFGNSSTNSTFHVGFLVSDQTTLTAWQTASGQDAASLSSNPLYNGNTNLAPQLGSPLVGAGVTGTGITLDRIGVTRNATPTIGSYENALDGAVPDITYSNLLGTCSVGDRLFTATITDASGVPTAGALQPRVYFRKNAGAWFSSQGVLASGTGLNGTWDFTILSATLGGLSIGDQVQYYVIAQDIAAIPNITSNPATGLVASDVNTVTVHPTTPNSYNIQNTLAPGTYTVGSGGNYTTLTAAIAAYNTSCLGGNIIFELIQASYSGSETFPISILTNPDASATKKLTIRPATGVTAAITGSVASNAVIRIQGSHILIDGSNNGTNSQNLTIENTSITSPNVLLIGSTGTTPVSSDTLKNCVLINGVNTSSALIVSDATTIGNDGYFNNIALINNEIRKAYMGMYIRAFLLAGNGSGLLVQQNNLAATTTNAIRFTGIYVQGVDGGNITKNVIGNFEGVSNEDDNGIWLATGSRNINVTNNVIDSLMYTGTSGYGGHGIYVSTGVTTINNPPAGANITVANNMISRLRGDGWSYTTVPLDNSIGIALSGTQDSIKVYHNTISLTGNTLDNTDAMSMGVYIGAGTNKVDLRNNIISNNLGLLSATGYGACGVYAVTANTQFSDINFNDYVVAPSGSGNKYIGQIASSGSSTLPDWQTATGKDAGSVSITPVFASSSNLHLPEGSNGSLFDLGTPIASVTTDIDMSGRSLTAPDMGADEFSPITLNLTAFIEGYYTGGTPPMRNVLEQSGVIGATSTQCDTLTVQLRNSTTPFAVAASFTGVLNRDGTLTCKFPSDKQGGTYFVALQHRNAMETWSGGGDGASATSFSGVTTNYNFTTSANQAYGGNMVGMGGGGTAPFALYSGDIDNNGEISSGDFTLWKNDSGLEGYFESDLDGNGEVASGDFTIWKNNSGVEVMKP